MPLEPLSFMVKVSPDNSRQGRWISPAFRLPGIRLTALFDNTGGAVAGAALVEGAVTGPTDALSSTAAVEVPADLVLQSSLEQSKFELEREKMALEESNRKRTWQWSIGSAVLTAAVTLTVAYLNKPDSPKTASGSGPATDAVEACRTSLRRLPLLAKSQGQTIQGLSEAIDRHETECDEVLVKILGMR